VDELDSPDIVLLLLIDGRRRRDVDDFLAPLTDGQAFEIVVLGEASTASASGARSHCA
jgi:hypothetical protein